RVAGARRDGHVRRRGELRTVRRAGDGDGRRLVRRRLLSVAGHAVEGEVGRGRVATGPRSVEPDGGRRTRTEVAVPSFIGRGHLRTRLGPTGAPAVVDPLTGGEGEGEVPAADRWPEVGDGHLSGEATLALTTGPVVGLIVDPAPGLGLRRGGRGGDQTGCHQGADGE